MSRNKIAYRSYVFMFFLAWLGMTNVSHAETLSVCYDQWAPMTIFPSEGAPARGVVIDMLDQIYPPEGYELEYYEVPLERGLAMVAEGLCDMLPEYPFAMNSEKDFVYADEETFAYSTGFVIRQGDTWRYNGIQSIRDKRIATGPGWDYSSMSVDYQSYIDDPQNSNFVEVISGHDDVVDRIVRMIKEGRIDLYVDNELVLQHVLNRLNLSDDLEIVRPGLENKLIELPIFSKKIPAAKRQRLISIWNEGRLSLTDEQKKTIFSKYDVILEE